MGLAALVAFGGGRLGPAVLVASWFALSLVLFARGARRPLADEPRLTTYGRWVAAPVLALVVVALAGTAFLVLALVVVIVAIRPPVGLSLVALALGMPSAWWLVGRGATAIGARWPAVREASARWVVAPRLVAASLAVAAVAWLVDFANAFAFAFFVILALIWVMLLANGIGRALARVAAGELSWRSTQRCIVFGVLWLTGLVVITLETSALGTYVLHGHGDGAYRLAESRRAEVDDAGFRGPPVPRERRAGVARVAFLGDSTTYGWLVAEREAYPRRVERILSGCGGHPVEVVNAGVPGYDARRMSILLATHVAEWQPDVVVVMTGPNDPADSPAAFRSSLEALLRQVETVGARVVLSTYPYGDPAERGEKNAVIAELARERGLTSFDAQAVVDGKPHDAFFLLDGEHPTPAGHAALAAALAPVIAEVLWPAEPHRLECAASLDRAAVPGWARGNGVAMLAPLELAAVRASSPARVSDPSPSDGRRTPRARSRRGPTVARVRIRAAQLRSARAP